MWLPEETVQRATCTYDRSDNKTMNGDDDRVSATISRLIFSDFPEFSWKTLVPKKYDRRFLNQVEEQNNSGQIT